VAGTWPALAQQHPSHERGFDPEKMYQLGDIDSVNLLNGGVSISIPIGSSYPLSERFAYGPFSLVYNSKAWDFQEAAFQGAIHSQAVPDRLSNAGMGWSLSLGRIIGPDSPYNDYETEQWVYISPDGADHRFYKDLHDNGPPGIDHCETVCFTRDSTYLRLRKLSNTVRELDLPDGTIHTFTRFTVGPQWEWRLTAIRDSFEEGAPGSADVTIGYSADGHIWTIGDRLGRSHTVTFEKAQGDRYPRRLVQVKLQAFGGDAVYQFSYLPVAPIDVPCGSTLPNWTSVAASQLSSVVLPDGTSYGFTYYDHLESGTCHAPGVLHALHVPTGGILDYRYRDHILPITGCSVRTWHRSSAAVATRTLRDRNGAELGKWTYSASLSQPPPPPAPLCEDFVAYNPPPEVLTVTVETPLRDRHLHYFSVWPGDDNGQTVTAYSPLDYGLPFTRTGPDGAGRFKSTEVFDCNESGGACLLRRTSRVRFERDASTGCGVGTGLGACADTNRRLAAESTSYEDGKFTSVERSDWDQFGHYRTETLGGNFGSGDSRQTTTGYNPGNVLPGSKWILGIYGQQTTTEGSSIARREVCFDPDTGFLLRERILGNGTQRANTDVLTVLTSDAAGNTTREESYGGDGANLNTTSALCSVGLPTQRYRMDHGHSAGVRSTSRYFDQNGAPLTFFSLERSIHPGTGLVTSAKDTSAIATSYEYDTSGRLTWTMPATGHGGWVEHAYTTDPGTGRRAAVTRRRGNGGKAQPVLAEEKVLFDDFGRVWRQQVLMPDDTWSTRETLYNAMGWRVSVSELGNTNALTKYLDYDPFGRPQRVTAPDGHEITLTYEGVHTAGRAVEVEDAPGQEHLAWTTEVYDRQGRLRQVKEEAEDDHGNTTTTYFYDVGGRVIRVQQATSAGTQNRFFEYDQRGFLLSELHPEKGGPAGGGIVVYEGYDPRGHAGRRYECAAGTCRTQPQQRFAEVTFDYDRAERLTRVTKVSTGRLLKEFTYGTSNAAGIRNNGKLLTATRHNHHTLGSGQNTLDYDVEVEESYTYGGRDGRVSNRATQLYFSNDQNPTPVAEEAFSVSWVYDPLGNVATITYPRCTAGDCLGLDASRTVTNAYTKGRLTAVTGMGGATYANSLEYHPNGMTKRIVHGNGVSFTVALDPSGMARPRSLSTAGSSGDWSSGNYQYDGAGNVTTIGQSTFTYDHVSRLETASIPVDSASSGLIFADGFESGDTSCWDPGSCPPGTQLFSQTYDYDPFGNLQSIAGNPGRMTPTSTATNRLDGGSYDVAGNLVQWNGNTYEYDAFGMMTRRCPSGCGPGQDDWRFLYTADDERLWIHHAAGPTPGGWWTVRDLDGRTLREYEGYLGWLARDYVYRDDQLLASHYESEGIRHFHLDHLGTPRLITGAGGARVAYHVYAPFGEEITSATQDTDRRKFTGHERDTAGTSSVADDKDYMHARFYNPLHARFLSVDLGPPNPGAPQTWNRYAYVANNPVRFTDPSGMVIDCGDSFASGSGGYSSVRCTEEITVTAEAPPSSADLAFGEGLIEADAFMRAYGTTGDARTDFAILAAQGDPWAAAMAKDARGIESGSLEMTLALLFVPGGLPSRTVSGGGGALAVRETLAITEHTAARMAERGVTESMIGVALRRGSRFWDPKNRSVVYVLEKGMASGKDLLVARNPVTGQIKTVIVDPRLVRPRFVPVQ
jgi:RHS repeat-associated protein